MLGYIFYSFTVFGDEPKKNVNFIVTKGFNLSQKEEKIITANFNQALLKLASYFELKLPLESISVIPAKKCANKASNPMLANVICYADYYYPVERIYGLPGYRNNLAYYLLSKHLVYKNIHSRWFGLQAGQTKTHEHLEQDDAFIAGVSLLVQEILSQEIYPDDTIIKQTACSAQNLSNLYYLFLKEQYQKNPKAVLAYIKYLFDKKYINKESQSFLNNLGSTWRQFKTSCKNKQNNGGFSDNSFFIKNYWPNEINVFENITNLQAVKKSPEPQIRSIQIIEKQAQRTIKKLSRNLITNYQIDNIDQAFIKKTRKQDKAFLQDKQKKKVEISLTNISDEQIQIRDISYSSFSNVLAVLTSNEIYKLEMTGPKQLWLKYKSSNFPMTDILTFSKVSLNEQILLTVANYKNTKRTALLWDMINDSSAPVLKTASDTYSPKWTFDNKGIIFLVKKGNIYAVYHLDLISKQYHVLFETELPLTSIASCNSNQLKIAALNKKGSFILTLDISQPIRSHIYDEQNTQIYDYSTTPLPSSELTFESSEEPSRQVWSFKLSPFIWSETKGFLAGLTFDANKYDNSSSIAVTAGYDISAKDVEFDINLDLYDLLLIGNRQVEPLLTGLGWRDTGTMEFAHNFNLVNTFDLGLGIKYLTITSDNISTQRHNLLGPTLKLQYTVANLLNSQVTYSLVFLTSDETKIFHTINWDIVFEKKFPIIGLKLGAHGQSTFKDNQGLLWQIAGGQLWPIYRQRPLTLRGFSKTSFYEPHLGVFNFEFPITIYKNTPPPVPGAIWSDLNQPNLGFLWWDIKLVPLSDIIVSSMRNFDKHWSWSGGGELRLSLHNSFLSIFAFSGAYYAGQPKNDWTYNVGGGFTW
ncbi:MAG: hypothetical protein ABH859_03870 [Pseudomonadota bacterium]